MRLNKHEVEAIARIIKRELIALKDAELKVMVEAYQQSEEFVRIVESFEALCSAIDSYNKLVPENLQVEAVGTPGYCDKIYIINQEKAVSDFKNRMIAKFKAVHAVPIPGLSDIGDMVVCQALSSEGSEEIINTLVEQLSKGLVSN